MVGSSNSTSDGSLLLVVCKTLSGEVSTSTLGDLEDDGSLDIAITPLVSGLGNFIERVGCTEQPQGRRLRSMMRSHSENGKDQTCAAICRVKSGDVRSPRSNKMPH